MYSVLYPDSVIDEYAGGLAFEGNTGLVNFCWIHKDTLVRDMEDLAQEETDKQGREATLVRHDGRKNKVFKPDPKGIEKKTWSRHDPTGLIIHPTTNENGQVGDIVKNIIYMASCVNADGSEIAPDATFPCAYVEKIGEVFGHRHAHIFCDGFYACEQRDE